MADLTLIQATDVTITAQMDDGGVAPDIRSDTVRLYLYHGRTEEQVLSKLADVASQGASGIALIVLTAIDTNIAPGNYRAEIVWTRQSGAVHALIQTWTVLARLSAP